ncbi:hypothetical protein HMPREF9592_00486 [Cutibacterium acnes HL046PA1]|nr:hypothetical protein HMPREF9592_00486 [Cutibacterium acnes HL046PA1]PKC24022.1 hypothetical protein APS64_07700 [Cutibacterium acnes]
MYGLRIMTRRLVRLIVLMTWCAIRSATTWLGRTSKARLGHDISQHRELVTDMELARPIRQGAEAFYLSLQIALK